MRTIAIVLILALIGSTLPLPCAAATEADTRCAEVIQSHPNARVYRISPEEYRQIEPLLREQTAQGKIQVIQLAQAEPRPPAVGPRPAQAPTNGVAGGVTRGVPGLTTNPPPGPGPTATPGDIRPPRPPPPEPPTPVVDGRSCEGFFDLVHDLGSGSWSDSDAAVVIFVVIGVVVVLAVVVYAGVFLYEAVAGVGEHTYWWDVETQTSFFSGRGNQGFVAGGKFSTGLEREHTRVGAVLEGGYLNARLQLEDRFEDIRLGGVYGLAGAGVRWAFFEAQENPSYLGLELLAGTASDSQVHLMSAARATLSFGLGARVRLGASLGALYMGLEPAEGLLKDANNFSTLMGVQAGYRF